MTPNSIGLKDECVIVQTTILISNHYTILMILYKKLITIISKCPKYIPGVTGVTTKFHKCIVELNDKLNNDKTRDLH